ncbi:P-loop containing nucleoside triphosphate hydrolase protein [Epithele typhae]|uniref:P-loop containing nucleoside triphosphate hydrolase protein n=1 Tax=Epithele typhae TaxID=378194 RepID=UPI002007BE6B|nr:P-loop containing nucleoside triphosphate hydrolase protein [Epithele typhae]KAH9917929.1 P-loop containing nucleoside triphosphate hydrolase protein [Epithele typhae]
MFSRGKQFSDKKGTFNPYDTSRVKHTRLGVWDLYEEQEPKLAKVPGTSRFEQYMDLIECMPYVWRMVKDVLGIPSCAFLFAVHVACQFARAMMATLGTWCVTYTGSCSAIMQQAIDTRTVNTDDLLHICVGRIACGVGNLLCSALEGRIRWPLTTRIRRYYDVRLFRARARLDLPTIETTRIQRQLDDASSTVFGHSVAHSTLAMGVGVAISVFQLVAQVIVLLQLLRHHRDGILLAALSLSLELIGWLPGVTAYFPGRVWAATTSNEDYVKMEGWRRVINDISYRKEIVTGNLGEYASNEHVKASDRVGDDQGDLSTWRRERAMWHNTSPSWHFVRVFLTQAPQIVFTLRVMQYPASMPVSLASLHLINNATSSFGHRLYEVLINSKSMGEQFSSVRKMYEADNIINKVADGTIPFPEDSLSIRYGIALEFKNVSFKYPDADKYALRNISFKLLPGQLCVIVGVNGSGKSTILKLVTRLYEPEQGQILFGGHDIRTLKLFDLRQAVSVLFQDYTHFPLSIRDNIGIGDPDAAQNEAHIRLAARLGGAEEFIKALPEGFDTYLDRPVRDQYSDLPEGTKTLFGREISYTAVRDAGGMKGGGTSHLSGGQMQRLAVARTFMRSIVSEDSKVGLLLFDEPSAALDPVAEHDLFERLRELRGNKTMVFSSHRFGNLTRYADLILYMNDSVVVEAGSHEELLKREGEYAKIWNLQAKAFL